MNKGFILLVAAGLIISGGIGLASPTPWPEALPLFVCYGQSEEDGKPL